MIGSTLLLLLLLVTETPQPLANPVECRESEYLDAHGKCTPCMECGPGLELSKECGYGEGSDAQCAPCHPRRFKDSWGHHGCKPCLSCSLINRIQKSQCTAASDAVCGACFSGFYSKTQIGGLQDLECFPCTKQTPPSEPQCRSRVSPVKIDNPPGPPLDTSLVVITTSALVVLVLVSLLSLLYCQRFWKSQCQRVFLRTRDFSGQRVSFQAAARPAGFPCQEQLPSPCCLGIQSASPCHGPLEGPAEAAPFFSEGEVRGFHLASPQPDQDVSKLIPISPKALQARSPWDTQPLLRNSGCSDCSAGGSSFTELRHDSAGDPDNPTPLSSCATELQHPWPHAPVECTELDLQNFSSRAKLLDKEAAEEERGALRGRTALAPVSCVDPTAQAKLAFGSPHHSCLSFQNPAAESGEQLQGGDVQSPVDEIGDIARVGE
ncbi:tumor necrosis factor receptor superfamily member 27 isoform X2 [Eublepharis macularius]|uniref:Tumor necrosis factor receptor superfamily member 27 isoform X2 n=1 Tax=Eublepharis macularius TaxID=481883 RepID=A0AA97LEF4_EUBMA|nr:tumor necrosis factor receptor superfamily member 27 isoform X2 [Eublepharis macularius]